MIEGDYPIPNGLLFTAMEAIKSYGPVEVIRACHLMLDSKLKHPDISPELREAVTKVSAAMRPHLEEAIDAGWEEWPYK